jgi:hypothetical protein
MTFGLQITITKVTRDGASFGIILAKIIAKAYLNYLNLSSNAF